MKKKFAVTNFYQLPNFIEKKNLLLVGSILKVDIYLNRILALDSLLPSHTGDYVTQNVAKVD